MNGCRAAREAGFSKKSAGAIAVQLLNKPIISEMVNKALEDRKQRLQIDADWVLSELRDNYLKVKALNELKKSDLFDDNGFLKPIHQWPEEWQKKRMIRGFEVQEMAMGLGAKGDKLKPIRTFIKKVHISDLVEEERKLLHLIGQHVGVGAFKESDSAPREFKITVEFEDGNPKAKINSSQEHGKPNGHAAVESH